MLALATAVPLAKAQVPSPPPGGTDEPVTPIPVQPAPVGANVMLGQRLFEDPRLSGDGRRSCLSCHDTRTNGAAPAGAATDPGGRPLPLDTTTIFNVGLRPLLNWTGSYRSLEAQAKASIENPAIMDATMATVLDRLRADGAMAEAFQHAYGRAPDEAALLDALAAYERSLTTPNSRFDRWLQGDQSALSPQEADGYRAFKTLGCASCHQGVNLGANLFQRHGIFAPLGSPEPRLLRVPSLRNVAVTAPYFHEGKVASLPKAVRGMARAQLGRALSDEQVASIVAFLQTLTGTYHGRPVTPAP